MAADVEHQYFEQLRDVWTEIARELNANADANPPGMAA